MKLTVDSFGRIVIPKPIREKLGLRAGTEVEILEETDRIVLTPVLPVSQVQRNKDGLLVLVGEQK